VRVDLGQGDVEDPAQLGDDPSGQEQLRVRRRKDAEVPDEADPEGGFVLALRVGAREAKRPSVERLIAEIDFLDNGEGSERIFPSSVAEWWMMIFEGRKGFSEKNRFTLRVYSAIFFENQLY
jgi:hypothetical protein